MKLCWVDIRGCESVEAVIEEAVHQRVHGIVAADPSLFATVPPTIKKILMPGEGEPLNDIGATDILIVGSEVQGPASQLLERYPDVEFGRFVEVVDAPTLELACEAGRQEKWTVIRFQDPTKIPLEIVIAATAHAEGNLITQAEDSEEARIIFGVLEHGSTGVMMRSRSVGDATKLKAAAADRVADVDLVELQITGITHVGMGERACVDTCTYFHEDEGILVGSHSKGMILCVSETHPLPYMPTRPFRVNAGAIMSYTLSTNGRTNYLSELVAGSSVLAVDVKGQARQVTVGRVKIETRPLLSVDAVAPDGTRVNLILQDDWHVRVLGPGGAVLNSTELKAGDRVLGHLPTEDRHVGYPIEEFCLEQ